MPSVDTKTATTSRDGSLFFRPHSETEPARQ
jgi:hypothetical protein